MTVTISIDDIEYTDIKEAIKNNEPIEKKLLVKNLTSSVTKPVEIDNIIYIENDINEAIKNNNTIEDKLHLIICVSNPCQFIRRYILCNEFIKRIEKDFVNDIILYVVELCYNNQEFQVTEKDNPRHLQLRTNTSALWSKENMWNLGVKLLPTNYKAVAFSDCDIEFTNLHFAKDILKILNGCRDILHMHSHCLDLNLDKKPMSIFSSFGYQYSNTQPYSRNTIHFFHPGFTVCFTRKAFEQIGGVYQQSILGAGDHNLFLCLIGNGIKSLHPDVSDGYKKSIIEFEKKCKGLRLGSHQSNIIKHFFHGSKLNRQYAQRWQVLIKHQYDPYKHITIDHQGLQIPSKECPEEMLKEIMLYFSERNEDEYYLEHLEKLKKLSIKD